MLAKETGRPDLSFTVPFIPDLWASTGQERIRKMKLSIRMKISNEALAAKINGKC
jgi:hypothetical protein